jgi:hypothetical protein
MLESFRSLRNFYGALGSLVTGAQDYSRAKTPRMPSSESFSLRPLRLRSGHALRPCARYFDFCLRLGRAALFIVLKLFDREERERTKEEAQRTPLFA